MSGININIIVLPIALIGNYLLYKFMDDGNIWNPRNPVLYALIFLIWLSWYIVFSMNNPEGLQNEQKCPHAGKTFGAAIGPTVGLLVILFFLRHREYLSRIPIMKNYL